MKATFPKRKILFVSIADVYVCESKIMFLDTNSLDDRFRHYKLFLLDYKIMLKESHNEGRDSLVLSKKKNKKTHRASWQCSVFFESKYKKKRNIKKVIVCFILSFTFTCIFFQISI